MFAKKLVSGCMLGIYLTSICIAQGVELILPTSTNILVTPTQISATLTFTTNEVATSSVAYGTSVSYELPPVAGASATVHSLLLEGLTCGTTYHYQITTTNALKNTAQTSDQTFVTNSCPVPFVPAGGSGFDPAAVPDVYFDVWPMLYIGEWENALYINWDGNPATLITCEYSYEDNIYHTVPCTIQPWDSWGAHITAPSVGAHTLYLRATNASSQVGTAGPIAFTGVADGTPIIYMSNPSNNQVPWDSNSWAPYVDFVDNLGDLTLCEYSYDNIIFHPVVCTNSGSDIPPPVTSGAHTLYLRATDSLANTGTAQALFDFIVIGAPTIIVNSLLDDGPGNCDTQCTLRDAVAIAQPSDTIQFGNLSGTIVLTNHSPITISQDLIIQGPGAGILTIDFDNDGSTYINQDGGNLTISGLTLTHAPYNVVYLDSVSVASFTLNNSVVANNTEQPAIQAQNINSVTINNSTFYNNTSGYYSAAIYSFAHETTINNSTFYNNHGQQSGAVFIEDTVGGTATLTNSTFYNNTSAVGSSMIETDTSMTNITNSTFVDTVSTSGHGVHINGSSSVVNSIFYSNQGGYSVCGGSLTSAGHNIDSGTSCGLAGTADQNSTDPLLSSSWLTNNGGSVKTIAILTGSPAKNNGDDGSAPATDARGYARSGIADIGAYEYQDDADITKPIITAFTIPATSNSLTVDISSLTATDNTGVTGYILTEVNTEPALGNASWTLSAPTTYTFATEGAKTLYAWTKDAAGNISTSSSAPVTIALPPGPNAAFCATVTDIFPIECEALLEIYDTMGGTGWNHHDGWGVSTTVGGGNWWGVTVSGGHVTGLDLASKPLTGTLPAQFHNLSYLTLIDLNSNEIIGIDPAAFSGLTNVTEIYLHANQITTLAVGTFTGLTNLQTLSLENNLLTDLPATIFNGLSSLVNLYLGMNQIASLDAGLFTGLSNLGDLAIGGNKITTLAAGTFTGLSSIYSLQLWGNCITGGVDAAEIAFANTYGSNIPTDQDGVCTGGGDTTAPTIQSLSPLDNATGVNTTTNLTITFSEIVSAGTGDILIKKISDNSTVETIDVTSGQVTGGGTNTIAINPSVVMDSLTGYYIQVADGALKDTANNSFAGIADNTTWNFTTIADLIPPTIQSLSPADNATGVNTTTDLTITFSEIVSAGTGNIIIKKISDSSTVETIDVTSGQVTGGGTNTITINPSVTLGISTEYYVQVAAGALKDAANNLFAGIANNTTWNFTTVDLTPPTIQSLSPLDNATGVNTTTNLTITFSEIVSAGTGDILIKKISDNSTVETIDVTSGQVTGGGTNTIAINPSVVMDSLTGYYIQVADGALKDTANNSFAGIANNTTWNFTTVDLTPPTIQSLSPLDNATGVNTTTNLTITFSEIVSAGTGNILIKKLSDNSTVETIDVTSGQVTGGGTNTITINPSVTLNNSTEYYVQVADGALKDTANNSFAGIANNTTWNFTTIAEFIPPTVQSLSPADNATSVNTTTNLTITFSEIVSAGTGDILIKKISDNSTVETIDVTSGQVTGGGTNTIIINPAVMLDNSTEYYIQVAAGALKDAADNPFAGIVDNTTWNFTTAAVSPYAAFCATVTGAPAAECEALLSIYDVTGGPSWTAKEGWGQTTTICSWTGITCSGDHVTVLELYGNNLIGNLGFTNGTLGFLETLSVGGNALTGLNLAGMNGLTILYMNDNLISTLQNIPNMPLYPASPSLQIYNGSNNCFLRSSMDPTITEWLDTYGVDWTRNVLCPAVPICDTTDIPKAECEALMSIYNNNNGTNWFDKTGWGTSDKVCTWGFTPWTGVTCSGGHVTGLDLYNNNLSGAFAITEGNLNSLTNLSLMYNGLTSFSNAGLASLTSLALIHNNLTSFDATGLGALTTLRLGENMITTLQNTDVLVNIGDPIFHDGQYPWTESFLELNGNCLRAPELAAPLVSWIQAHAAYQPFSLNSNGLCPADSDDGLPPTVYALSPADGVNNIGLNADLVMTFSKVVTTSTGNILIKKLSDNSTVETIDVTSGQVTGGGTNTITINPSVTLDNSTEYYVQIDAGTVQDIANRSFAGIADNTTWNFSTIADLIPPTIQSLSPADNSTGVSTTTDLTITFSEIVSAGTGNIIIKKRLDNSFVEAIDVTSGQVTGGGTNTITINPSVALGSSAGYYVQVAAGALKDAANNPFAGITNNITWNLVTTGSGSYVIPPQDLPIGDPHRYEFDSFGRQLTFDNYGYPIESGEAPGIFNDDHTPNPAWLESYPPIYGESDIIAVKDSDTPINWAPGYYWSNVPSPNGNGLFPVNFVDIDLGSGVTRLPSIPVGVIPQASYDVSWEQEACVGFSLEHITYISAGNWGREHLSNHYYTPTRNNCNDGDNSPERQAATDFFVAEAVAQADSLGAQMLAIRQPAMAQREIDYAAWIAGCDAAGWETCPITPPQFADSFYGWKYYIDEPAYDALESEYNWYHGGYGAEVVGLNIMGPATFSETITSIPWGDPVVDPVTVTCEPSATSALTGQPISWTAVPSGGTGNYTYEWTGDDGLTGTNNPLSKTYNTIGVKTASVVAHSGALSSTPTACSSTVTTSIPPVTVTCTPSATSALTGQPITWTAVPSGGTGNYTYEWTGTDSLTGTGNPLVKTYSTTGTKTASVVAHSGALSSAPTSCGETTATGGGGGGRRSSTPTRVTCSASSTSAPMGTPITWTAVPTGGNGIYTYNWTGTDNLSGTNNPLPKIYNTAGTKTATVTVTSGTSVKSATCSKITAVANSNPLTVTCAPSDILNSAGQPVTWTAVPSGSTGNYTYEWTGDDGLTGTNNPLSKTYSTTGDKTATVTVTSGTSVKSATCSTTTFDTPLEPLTVTCTPSDILNSAGQPITWTAVPSGGNGIYTYNWTGTDDLAGTNNPLPKIYNTPGVKTVTVTVSSGASVESATCSTVTVTTPQIIPTGKSFAVTCLPSDPTTSIGQPITWTAVPSGGNGDYTYSWRGTNDLTGVDNPVSKTYTTAGVKTATVTVSSGVYVTSSTCPTITVDAPPEPPTVICLPSDPTTSIGKPITWTAVPSGGNGDYTYSWRGTNDLTGVDNPVSKTYTTTGVKTATVTVSSGGRTSAPAACSSIITEGTSHTHFGCTDINALNYEPDVISDPLLCEYPHLGIDPVLNSAPIIRTAENTYCSARIYPTKYIRLGQKNDPAQVTLLEQYLTIYEGESLPIDGFYAKQDESAVVRWQEKYRSDILTPWEESQGTGYVFITSLRKFKELFEAQCKPDGYSAPVDPPIFTRDLRLGMEGDDVRKLQEILIAKATGQSAQELARVGVTGYFGPLTKRALIEFQTAQLLNPATGEMGIITIYLLTN